MRKLWVSLCCCLIGVGWLSPLSPIYAEDVFPEFTTSSLTLYISIDEMLIGYQPDPDHDIGQMNLQYTIQGQVFTDPAGGHLQTLAEGFSGTTDRATPWKTLTEVLAAYQSADMEAVKRLHTAATQVEIDAALADPEINAKYLEFMQAMTGIDVLIGFDHKDGFLALVHVHFRNPESGATQTEIQPIFFVRENSMYLLSAQTLDEAIDTNIAIFLKNHTVADFLELPPTKYKLTIEKQGTGDGYVVGHGIVCGEDCSEFYREGKAIFLKALPSPDCLFAGWLLDGKPLKGQIKMLEDMTITAVFQKR